MRKTIPVLENKVSLSIKAPKLRDEHEKHYVLTVSDTEKQLLSMLEYVKQIANGGHSFKITVDPGNSNYEKDFYIDGDGWDKIFDIAVEDYGEG